MATTAPTLILSPIVGFQGEVEVKDKYISFNIKVSRLLWLCKLSQDILFPEDELQHIYKDYWSETYFGADPETSTFVSYWQIKLPQIKCISMKNPIDILQATFSTLALTIFGLLYSLFSQFRLDFSPMDGNGNGTCLEHYVKSRQPLISPDFPFPSDISPTIIGNLFLFFVILARIFSTALIWKMLISPLEMLLLLYTATKNCCDWLIHEINLEEANYSPEAKREVVKGLRKLVRFTEYISCNVHKRLCFGLLNSVFILCQLIRLDNSEKLGQLEIQDWIELMIVPLMSALVVLLASKTFAKVRKKVR